MRRCKGRSSISCNSGQYSILTTIQALCKPSNLSSHSQNLLICSKSLSYVIFFDVILICSSTKATLSSLPDCKLSIYSSFFAYISAFWTTISSSSQYTLHFSSSPKHSNQHLLPINKQTNPQI